MQLTKFQATLNDGTSVVVREVMPADRRLLEVGFAHLSDRAKYFRFLTTRHDLSAKELDLFTAASAPSHVAVGALIEGRAAPEPAGIARYVCLPGQPDVAEIAITISDALQHQGLGTLLLGVLARSALRNGICEFQALVHCDNTPMLRLLAQHQGIQTPLGGAEIDVRIPISGNVFALPVAKNVGQDQPISVWVDDGGATVKDDRRTPTPSARVRNA